MPRLAVSIIMCDIDHFKRVNDTYGHNAGDAVLEHVANILKDCVRESDTVYRWGGEEFIIFLAKANLDQSAMVAERMRKRIEDSTCTFEGTDIKITMSFGCSEMTPDISVEENIKIADTRLYIAKETGRNQVIKETIESYEKVES